MDNSRARQSGAWRRGEAARRPPVIAPGGEALARIAEELGLRVSFPCHVPRRGDGSGVVYYVSVYRVGQSCQRKQLGRLDVLAAQSEDELRATIVAAFAKE